MANILKRVVASKTTGHRESPGVDRARCSVGFVHGLFVKLNNLWVSELDPLRKVKMIIVQKRNE